MKVIIEDAIIAFFFFLIICLIGYAIFGKKIENYENIVKAMTIEKSTAKKDTTVLDIKTQKIKNYPKYGEIFGVIKMPSIDVLANVTEGDSLDILKTSAGHYEGSYFPGEGGTIILAAHNGEQYFKKIPNLVNGDKIYLETSYGTFIYKVYDEKIIGDKEFDKMPIQNTKEILILYTCYPVDRIGFKDHRYVVYAELEG
jgi:sortase A